MNKKYFTKINLFGEDIYVKDEDLTNKVTPNYFEAISNEPYIGVPEVTSFVKGLFRIDTPGLYIVTVRILAPIVPTKLKTFEYYICPSKRPAGVSFDESKEVRRIVSYTEDRTANVADTVTFLFNVTSDVINSNDIVTGEQSNTIDLLLDAFSYNLNEGDSNIPLQCKSYVSRLLKY